jgi:hypothetical protein
VRLPDAKLRSELVPWQLVDCRHMLSARHTVDACNNMVKPTSPTLSCGIC